MSSFSFFTRLFVSSPFAPPLFLFLSQEKREKRKKTFFEPRKTKVIGKTKSEKTKKGVRFG